MPAITETEAMVFPCCGHCEDGRAGQPCGIPHGEACEHCQDPS